MKYYYVSSWAAVAMAVCWSMVGVAPCAQAGRVKFKEGRWRLELTGATGLDKGKRDRDDDQYGTVSLEYESPYHERFTLGFRLYPALFYGESDSAAIFGAGFGVANRVYQRKDRTGLFAEVGGAALFLSSEFRGNTSDVNFFVEAGVGYEFEKDWHLGIKVQHISNAGIGSENAGVNGLGLALGYRFRARQPFRGAQFRRED